MSSDEKIIRLPQVMEKVGLKKSAIYKLINEGSFPAQIKLGKRASGWLESDVQVWIMKQAGKYAANDDQPQAA